VVRELAGQGALHQRLFHLPEQLVELALVRRSPSNWSSAAGANPESAFLGFRGLVIGNSC
jgi:hypothetical protein